MSSSICTDAFVLPAVPRPASRPRLKVRLALGLLMVGVAVTPVWALALLWAAEQLLVSLLG